MNRLWLNGRQQPVYVFCDGSTGALERWEAAPAGDGAARQRAGSRCAAAAVARAADGAILAIEWQALPSITNNEAEYAGLLLGIAVARRLRPSATVFVLDSETVVCQMTGRCGVNSPGLKVWHARACSAVRALSRVRYQAIPRQYNRLADGAAGQAAIAWEELMLMINPPTGGANG